MIWLKIIVIFFLTISVRAEVFFSVLPAYQIVDDQENFVTRIAVRTSGENQLGALLGDIQYDENIFEIVSINVNGGNANDLSVDSGSFQTGTTKIAWLPATVSGDSRLDIEVTLSAKQHDLSTSTLSFVPQSVIDQEWKSVQTNQWEALVEISPLDSDGDNLPDSWENIFFGGIEVGLPDEDSDSDGLTNIQEYIAGTNPLDATDSLKVFISASTPNKYLFEFSTVLQREYDLEHSKDLQNWSVIMEDIKGDGDIDVIEITMPDDSKANFFRVRAKQ